MKCFLYPVLMMLVLVGCSSSYSGRAPVNDVKSRSGYKIGIDNAREKPIRQSIYTVQAGDTLYSIAKRSKVDIKVLAKRNGIKKPYIIHKGQKIHITRSKPKSNKKQSRNSDLVRQNKQRNQKSQCTGQSCNKKPEKKVVPAKTKAYSATKVDGKATKDKKIVNKKVTGWLWPAQGRITKTYSSSRSSMKGISISNQRGTVIKAAASGQVVYAGNGLRGYGNLIIIKHNYDYLSAYAHNEKLLVKESEHIKVGQKIALMGDSGTEGVQLHFEIRYRGKSVDPLRYLPKR